MANVPIAGYLAQIGEAVLVLAFAGASGQAAAVEYNVSLGYAGEYTDNARRTADQEVSDIIHRPYVSAAVEHLSPRLELGANYRLQQRSYQDDTFEERNIAQGSGWINWEALPRHLTVFATDQRRESEIRVAEQATPDNLQKTGRSSVGATLSSGLFAGHIASVTYEHIVIDAEETTTDSDRNQVTASYLLPRSSVEHFEISASQTDTDFDDPLAPDYRAVTGNAAWDRTTTRSHILLRGGYTEVDRDMQREDIGGVVGGVELSRTLSDQSIVQVSYTRDVNDNSLNADGRYIDLAGDGFAGDTDLNEVFIRDELALTYATDIGANALGLQVFGSKNDYEDVDRDAKRYGAQLEVSRSIRPRLSANALVRYERYRFELNDQIQDQYEASAGFDWQVTRRLRFGMFGAHFARRVEGADDDIDEWRVGVEVDFLLLGTMR